MRVIGLMSGTSLDGIDAALVSFDGDLDSLKWELEAFSSTELTSEQRTQVHDAIVHGNSAALCRIHADLGEWFANAVLQLCREHNIDPATVDLIGSHGQTIWHEPPHHAGESRRRGATLQLGCASTIAERTGIAVVS